MNFKSSFYAISDDDSIKIYAFFMLNTRSGRYSLTSSEILSSLCSH